jgi:gamma-glutamyl hydrolase
MVRVSKKTVFPKKVVGIITVPLSPGKKYYQVCGDSYISTAHIEWLKDQGLEVLAIPFITDKHKYYFERINGLYLPSGGVFASNSEDYYKCCKEFIKLAIEANDNGDYFPIWGGCMGMQQMMIVADGQDNMALLEQFDSFNNLMLPLLFTDEGLDSNMMTKAKRSDPNYILKLMREDCTLNNHMMGLSPEQFKKSSQVDSFYKIVSYNYDRQGRKFVSTIEGRKHPFYGVQWHPERADNMKYFANFFANEVNKNRHTATVPKKDKLQYKKLNCMTYSGSIYKNCNFYWHSRTSIHNRKLCSVLNLGTPTNNSV